MRYILTLAALGVQTPVVVDNDDGGGATLRVVVMVVVIIRSFSQAFCSARTKSLRDMVQVQVLALALMLRGGRVGREPRVMVSELLVDPD
jgi:hypothetical protein